MRSRSRDRERHARAWRVILPVAGLLLIAAAGLAAFDVYDEARRPGLVTEPASSPGRAAEDLRRQVLVTVTVTADGPFTVGYVDAEGAEVEETSPDGEEFSVELAKRGNGPHLQVSAQVAGTGSFVQCRIEVDGEERAEERVEGPFAITSCIA